jgi:hypothetical protein
MHGQDLSELAAGICGALYTLAVKFGSILGAEVTAPFCKD